MARKSYKKQSHKKRRTMKHIGGHGLYPRINSSYIHQRAGALRKLPASQVDRIVKAEKDMHIGLNIEHPANYYINMKNMLKQLRFNQNINLMQIRIYGDAVSQASPSSRPKLHSSSSHKSSSSSKHYYGS